MNGLLEARCLLVFCGLLALLGGGESESMGGVEDSSSGGLGEGFLPYDNLPDLLSVFKFQAQVSDFGKRRLWGPDLIMPSEHTYILPWVLGGDPCVRRSRIPTANIHALRQERGLTTPQIVKLYPGLNPEKADDAYKLESRLRGTQPAAA